MPTPSITSDLHRKLRSCLFSCQNTYISYIIIYNIFIYLFIYIYVLSIGGLIRHLFLFTVNERRVLECVCMFDMELGLQSDDNDGPKASVRPEVVCSLGGK